MFFTKVLIAILIVGILAGLLAIWERHCSYKEYKQRKANDLEN